MGAALVVIDMVNAYDFEDADRLAANAAQRVPVIREQIEQAQSEGRPVIYVNDNLGEWRSERTELIEKAMNGRHPELVEPLLPPESAKFIFKLRHSIFYETPLDHLLRVEEIDSLRLVGQVTEQCILYSALDAYIRHLELEIVRDGVVPIHEDLADAALRMMEINMRARVI